MSVSGRRVELQTERGEDAITVRSAEGDCLLHVRMTEAGPVLRFQGAALELDATGDVAIACASLRLAARDRVAISGRDVSIEANRGGVKVHADDDVELDGERVLLNCADRPQQLAWESFLPGGDGPKALGPRS